MACSTPCTTRSPGDIRGTTEPSRALALLTLASTFSDSSILEGDDDLAQLRGGAVGYGVVGKAGRSLPSGTPATTRARAWTTPSSASSSAATPGRTTASGCSTTARRRTELDVYVSVLLHRSGTSGRERATALGGGVAWADVDGDWTPERQAALDALEVDAWHVESAHAVDDTSTCRSARTSTPTGSSRSTGGWRWRSTLTTAGRGRRCCVCPARRITSRAPSVRRPLLSGGCGERPPKA